MAKAPRAFCFHCEGRMDVGQAFCPRCGHPSIWATHDERVAWEVTQWRAVSSTKRSEVHTPVFVHRESHRREEAPSPVIESPPANGAVMVEEAPQPERQIVEPSPKPVTAEVARPSVAEDAPHRDQTLDDAVALLLQIHDRIDSMESKLALIEPPLWKRAVAAVRRVLADPEPPSKTPA